MGTLSLKSDSVLSISSVSVNFFDLWFYVVFGSGYVVPLMPSDDVVCCLLMDEKIFFFSAKEIARLSRRLDGRIEVLFMFSVAEVLLGRMLD